MRAYVATTNAGKMRELRALFAPHGWELDTYPDYVEVVEGADDYAENAALKARGLRAQLVAAGVYDVAVIGDDSGIEAAALGGAPGVLSARYGGAGATWAERRARLIAEVDATGGSRAARFVCVLHHVAPDGTETSARGEVAGTIAPAERGAGGFSYDAIFALPDGRTFAELSETEKNAISQRARAAAALLAAIAETEGRVRNDSPAGM